MNKVLKIGVLSLALLFSLFLLNHTTNAQAANGEARVQITAKTGSCMYGTSIFIGSTGFSYSAQSLSSVFTATNAALPWYCEDTEGDASWNLTLGMSTDLINMSNATIKISSWNLLVTNPQATVTNGSCTAGTYANTDKPLSGNVVLLAKTSAIWQVCTITTSSVSLKINIPAGQQPGIYSGNLTIGRRGTFGNGIMN